MNSIVVGQKFRLVVPENGIPEAGREALVEYLTDTCSISVEGKYHNLPRVNLRAWLDDLGFEWVWKTTRGTLPKRLSNVLHKQLAHRLPPDALSEIGNIAAAHTERSAEHVLDFSPPPFDWDRGDFGDDDSCFWTDRPGAKLMLEALDAVAVRFWDPRCERIGVARAWFVPTRCQNGFILFNAYHKSSCGTCYDALTMARLVAFHLGCSYQRVDPLLNNCCGDGQLWINGRKQNDYAASRIPHGYVVGDPEFIRGVKEYDFQQPTIYGDEKDEDDGYEYTCSHCGYGSDDRDEFYYPDNEYWCQDCYNDHWSCCRRCDDEVSSDDTRAVHHQSRYGNDTRWWCSSCASEYATVCDGCGERWDDDDIILVDDEHEYCNDCRDEYAFECACCGEWRSNCALGDATRDMCQTCVDEDYAFCGGCSTWKVTVENGVCEACRARSRRLMSVMVAMGGSEVLSRAS